MRRSSVVGLMALVLVAGVALCGDNKSEPPPKVKGKLPTGWRRLGLSDEQKDKIFEAQSKYAAQIADLTKQLNDLKKKETAELEELLTDAQRARLREIALEKVPADTPKETTKPANKPGAEDKTPEKKPTSENNSANKPADNKTP